MIRPWRIEIKVKGRWRVFGSYKSEENAKAAIPWARHQYFNTEDIRVKARSGWQQ